MTFGLYWGSDDEGFLREGTAEPFSAKFFDQRRSVQPQQLGRPVLVTLGSFQCLGDHAVLDVLQNFAKLAAFGWEVWHRCTLALHLVIPHVGGNIIQSQVAFTFDDNQPLDDILELPNVASPGVSF